MSIDGARGVPGEKRRDLRAEARSADKKMPRDRRRSKRALMGDDYEVRHKRFTVSPGRACQRTIDVARASGSLAPEAQPRGRALSDMARPPSRRRSGRQRLQGLDLAPGTAKARNFVDGASAGRGPTRTYSSLPPATACGRARMSASAGAAGCVRRPPGDPARRPFALWPGKGAVRRRSLADPGARALLGMAAG